MKFPNSSDISQFRYFMEHRTCLTTFPKRKCFLSLLKKLEVGAFQVLCALAFAEFDLKTNSCTFQLSDPVGPILDFSRFPLSSHDTSKSSVHGMTPCQVQKCLVFATPPTRRSSLVPICPGNFLKTVLFSVMISFKWYTFWKKRIGAKVPPVLL